MFPVQSFGAISAGHENFKDAFYLVFQTRWTMCSFQKASQFRFQLHVPETVSLDMIARLIF